MKLPICQKPVQIMANPTVWLSAEAARDWVARTIRRAAIDMTLEEAFLWHDAAFGRLDAPSRYACPAGDPCPATGCPACCPSYDPCGQKSCRNCNPKEGDMHVPEEANVTKKLTEEGLFARAAREAGLPVSQDHQPLKTQPEGHHWDKPRNAKPEMSTPCLRCGVTYRLGHNTECEADQGAPDEVLDEADFKARIAEELRRGKLKILENESGYPFTDTDGKFVLGPDVVASSDNSVINWKGQNYYEAPGPQAMAEPFTEDRLAERRAYMRRDSMEWAIKLMSAGSNCHNEAQVVANQTVQTAQAIFDWLTAAD